MVNVMEKFSDYDKLMDIFKKYDSLHPATFNKEKFKMELQKPGGTSILKDKIVLLNMLINKANNFARMRYGVIANIQTTFSADPEGPNIILNYNVSNLFDEKGRVLKFNLNIDFYKLKDMPAMEIYSIVTYHLVDAITKYKANMDKQNKTIDADAKDLETNYEDNEASATLEDDEQNVESKDDKIEKLKNKSRARKVVSKYLEGFLSNYCADMFTRFDNIADYIAGQIVEELDGETLKEILSPLFIFPSSLINKKVIEMADKIKDEFTGRGTFVVARITNYILPARDLQIEGASQDPADADGFLRQAEELKKNDIILQFFKPESEKGNVELVNFCETYVKNFMKVNGFKPIPVVFKKTKGVRREMGQFVDMGTSQHIEINLNAHKKGGNGTINFPELLNTLTHECTHAADAIRNKARGVMTQDGFGLVNGISTDISGAGIEKGSDEGKFLARINEYCYRLNPNERRARLSELVGIKLIADCCGEEDRKIVENTINAAKTYHLRTLKVAQQLGLTDSSENGNELYNLEIEFEKNLRDSLPITAIKLIEERLNYLRAFREKPLNYEKEMQLVEKYESLRPAPNAESRKSTERASIGVQKQKDEQKQIDELMQQQ